MFFRLVKDAIGAAEQGTSCTCERRQATHKAVCGLKGEQT